MRNPIAFLAFFLITFGVLCGLRHPPVAKTIQQSPPQFTKAEPVRQAHFYEITHPIPGYQDYPQIIEQLQEWRREAPDLVREVGVYGKSSRGKDLYFARISSDDKPKPSVLIHAAIHGNEPLSASTAMAIIGSLLKDYVRDPEATKILDTRTIYFIPVVCPDSYPNFRASDGVDPNRDFLKNPSVPSVEALKQFVLDKKPNAVISAHTFGREFLTPYGDRMALCPNNDDYNNIVGRMSELSGYRKMRACQLYGSGPIFGGEVDWEYRHGCFSIVCEMGTHQHKPSMSDVQDELKRTYKAFEYFMEEAPIVKLKQSWRRAA